MDLKQLIEKERIEKRERMQKEMQGGHILLYLMEGFIILSSMLFGFYSDGDMRRVYPLLIVGISCVWISANKYYYLVRENGTINNIFYKYRNIPVDLKKLYLAKAAAAGRNILGQALLAQFTALFIRIVDPDHDGGSVTNVTVWIPLMTGVGVLLLFLLLMGLKCRRASK